MAPRLEIRGERERNNALVSIFRARVACAVLRLMNRRVFGSIAGTGDGSGASVVILGNFGGCLRACITRWLTSENTR